MWQRVVEQCLLRSSILFLSAIIWGAMASMDLSLSISCMRHSAKGVNAVLTSRSGSFSLSPSRLYACEGLIPLRVPHRSQLGRRGFKPLGNGHGDGRLEGKLVYELVHSSNQNGSIRVQVTNNSGDNTSSSSPSTKKKSSVAKLVELPGAIWNQVMGPLSNFGFGKRSVWEGGVGLFVITGAVLLAITLVWVKGKQIRARTRKYEAVLEFQQAQGITVGTPVRIRGVDVGNVVGVRPSLERIDVVVELLDSGIVIPRNALVEVNQSGLISETLIDVTPQFPLPKPTFGPLDPNCKSEGLIVCDRERIKGEQGVSLDELVGVCTKIARQMDALGVNRMMGLAERLGSAVEDARPLLAKVTFLIWFSSLSESHQCGRE